MLEEKQEACYSFFLIPNAFSGENRRSQQELTRKTMPRLSIPSTLLTCICAMRADRQRERIPREVVDVPQTYQRSKRV